MNTGDLRLIGSPTLGPARSAAGAPPPQPQTDPEVKDRADLAPSSPAAPVATQPAVELPRAYYNVSLRVPASMVGGLAGCTLALVPEHEVQDGKWQPEATRPKSVEVVPHVLFADLAAAPAPGLEMPLLTTAFTPDTLGLQSPHQVPSTGIFLTSRGEAKTGRTLEQALQEATLPEGRDGILNVSLGFTPEEAQKLATSTPVLIPSGELQNGQWSPSGKSVALAPGVDRAIEPQRSSEEGVLVHTPVVAPPIELDKGDQLSELAYLSAGVHLQPGLGAEELAVLDKTLQLPWVLDKLEQEKVDPAHARHCLIHYTKMAQAGRAGIEDLHTADGRRDIAAANLLAHGMMFAKSYEQHGHDASERVKVALANNRPEQLLEEDGKPFLPEADLNQLMMGTQARLGNHDPFKAMSSIRALDERTSPDGVFNTQKYLGIQPESGSDMEYFLAAWNRHQNLPDGVACHNNLGAMKEMSDKILAGLEGGRSKRWLSYGLGAAVTAGAVITHFYPLLLVGVPQMLAAGHENRQAAKMIETEKGINRVLGELVTASNSEQGEAGLVEYVATHSRAAS